MHAIADTIKLVDDGVISKGQATTIEQRARESMMVLAINMLLGGGILAASGNGSPVLRCFLRVVR